MSRDRLSWIAQAEAPEPRCRTMRLMSEDLLRNDDTEVTMYESGGWSVRLKGKRKKGWAYS